MPEWCPECNAMLAEGTAECPRCGHQFRRPDEDPHKLHGEDILNMSLYVWLLALIPIAIIIVVGLLCYWSAQVYG